MHGLQERGLSAVVLWQQSAWIHDDVRQRRQQHVSDRQRCTAPDHDPRRAYSVATQSADTSAACTLLFATELARPCLFHVVQDRDRRTMLFEERLEAAERRRLEGNTLFAEGKYKEALAKYALVSNTITHMHTSIPPAMAG